MSCGSYILYIAAPKELLLIFDPAADAQRFPSSVFELLKAKLVYCRYHSHAAMLRASQGSVPDREDAPKKTEWLVAGYTLIVSNCMDKKADWFGISMRSYPYLTLDLHSGVPH